LYVKKGSLYNLKGITSITDRIGAKNPTCNDYAIFTDVTKFLEWIEEEINSI
jgi:secreted trypsin-like serine protease